MLAQVVHKQSQARICFSCVLSQELYLWTNTGCEHRWDHQELLGFVLQVLQRHGACPLAIHRCVSRLNCTFLGPLWYRLWLLLHLPCLHFDHPTSSLQHRQLSSSLDSHRFLALLQVRYYYFIALHPLAPGLLLHLLSPASEDLKQLLHRPPTPTNSIISISFLRYWLPCALHQLGLEKAWNLHHP